MIYLSRRFRQQVLIPLLAILVAALIISLSACDMIGMSDFTGSSDDAGTARMQVLLVDSPFPFDLVDEVNVTISRVELRGGEKVVIVMDEPRTFNLLELQNGVSAELGALEIPAGRYTQARLIVDDAVVLMNDGGAFDLKVPSGSVRVMLDGVEVEEGQDVSLTLDFDVDKSFVVQGNPNTPAGIKGFLLKPTVISKGMKENGRRGGDGDDDDEEEEDDNGDDDLEVSGVVTAIETIDGSTFLTVAGLQIMIVPGETEFDGISGVDALVENESIVSIEYFEDGETGVLIASKVEIQEEEEEEEEEEED